SDIHRHPITMTIPAPTNFTANMNANRNRPMITDPRSNVVCVVADRIVMVRDF
ncbi:4953_t:CDS:1, partial [Ambispora leptoticha]